MEEVKGCFCLIVLLLLMNWFHADSWTHADEDNFYKMYERNPLYRKKKRFRKARGCKRGSIFTAELKPIYFCQMIAAVLIILLVVYAVYSWFSDDAQTIKIGLLLSGLCFGQMIITLIITMYYYIKFELAYVAVPWKQWKPFAFTGHVHILAPMPVEFGMFKGFDEMREHVLASCPQKGYRLAQEKELAEGKKLFFWVKEERDCINIFEVIRFPFLEREDIELLNDTFGEFLKQVMKGKKKSTRIYFTFFICVDEVTRPFYYMMNRAVVQGIRRYRLPAGLVLEDGWIEVADMWRSRGKKAYKKMCREFYDIMGIKRDDIKA